MTLLYGDRAGGGSVNCLRRSCSMHFFNSFVDLLGGVLSIAGFSGCLNLLLDKLLLHLFGRTSHSSMRVLFEVNELLQNLIGFCGYSASFFSLSLEIFLHRFHVFDKLLSLSSLGALEFGKKRMLISGNYLFFLLRNFAGTSRDIFSLRLRSNDLIFFGCLFQRFGVSFYFLSSLSTSLFFYPSFVSYLGNFSLLFCDKGFLSVFSVLFSSRFYKPLDSCLSQILIFFFCSICEEPVFDMLKSLSLDSWSKRFIFVSHLLEPCRLRSSSCS